MARTPGSGWGAGPILWQICQCCGKKKAYYDPIEDPASRWYKPFRCTLCKERFDSDTLIRKSYPDVPPEKNK
jgi:hypothetical protein